MLCKKYTLILSSILLWVSFSSIYSQNYELVWSDEFDGTEINRDNWINESGGTGWGNNELQYYTYNERNSYIENGSLIIKAIKENYGGKSYTSARMKTQGLQDFQYGKLEARIKLPEGQGIWPAFWTLGSNINSVSWPKCGEIDIMEMIGGQGRENTVHGTVHWDVNGHAEYGESKTLSSGKYSDDFFVYSVEWTSKFIKWFINGVQYHDVDITPSHMSEFHQNHFFLLNLAVGGNWPKPPDATTQFPQIMEVDYVRVYQNVTDVKEAELGLYDFRLEQNYPNPFNPTTIIRYHLSSNSSVELKVFDLLGKEVASLVDKEQSAGTYSINYDASNLSNGTYFYRLRANDFVETKKFTLMK